MQVKSFVVAIIATLIGAMVGWHLRPQNLMDAKAMPQRPALEDSAPGTALGVHEGCFRPADDRSIVN
jgi:hypothetical protein